MSPSTIHIDVGNGRLLPLRTFHKQSEDQVAAPAADAAPANPELVIKFKPVKQTIIDKDTLYKIYNDERIRQSVSDLLFNLKESEFNSMLKDGQLIITSGQIRLQLLNRFDEIVAIREKIESFVFSSNYEIIYLKEDRKSNYHIISQSLNMVLID